ncbi:8-oxo-dGTP diphosphatase [BD1-7 clade bacterium]|uniref:8-oxo-dGTP diphosphatase n=1 Tax=BD1-7 clade bacterium TaxID=2029982 RepID=A0A5S9N4H1_9GAMM|nr:8-oxo-dGTP diphosphatase [BD1-7 clade bacterium]
MADDKSKKAIDVVAAIIWSQAGDRILVSRRPEHLHKGGCWEFPGGKRESGESDLIALARELDEELSVTFRSALHCQSLVYEYPEKTVSLAFYHVGHLLSEEPKANEGQLWQWVEPASLSTLAFPEANQPIVDALTALVGMPVLQTLEAISA